MLTERKPIQIAENTLTIEVDNKTHISYRYQDWYTNKDIARAVGKSPLIVAEQLRRVRQNDTSIEFITLRELNQKRNLTLTGKPQTIVCNKENFIKAVIAVVSIKTRLPPKTHSEKHIHKSPTSKDKAPKNHGENNHSLLNPFSSATLNAKKPQEIHRTRPKETLSMKDPKQILGINSVIKALSRLANGTLQETVDGVKEFLEQAAMEHVRLPRFENDPKENILTKILDSDSESRLNRFFKVNLEAMLYDLWDVTDTNERTSKKEKEIIELCNKLKEKGYDKERAAQELFDHFRESVILPKPLPSESPKTATPIHLLPAPIRKEKTIFEPENLNRQPKQDRTKTKKTRGKEKPYALPEQDEQRQRLQRPQEELLFKASFEILKQFLANERILPNVRITLGRHLAPKTTIPQIFGNASQEELNNLVIEKLRAILLNDPGRDQISSKVKAILESSHKPAP